MNLFQLFTGSFHSAAAYRYMRAKASFGMGYALFVVVLTTLFVMLYFGLPIYTVGFMGQNGKPPLVDQVAHDIARQAPVMTLKGDTLVSNVTTPTILSIRGDYGDKKFDVPFATIDTTGETTTDTVTTSILVTAKELHLKSQDQWKSQPLTDFTKDGPETIIINHAMADDMASRAVDYLNSHLFEYYLIVWWFFITCLFIFSFITLLVLGLFGLAIGSTIKSPVSFGASVALASLSFTPVAILDAVLLTVFGYAPHFITLLMAGIVTLYAAIKCSDPASGPRATV